MPIIVFILSSLIWAPYGVFAQPSGVAPAKPTCSTTECHSSLTKKKYLHGPIKSKGCTICHQIQGRENILLKGKEHPAVKKLIPTEINESCFVCHEEHQAKLHKAKKVHTAIEKKSCVGCHDPHQSDIKSLLKQKPQKELCLSCHEDIGKKFQSATHHTFEKMEKGCLSCHESHSSASATKLLKFGSMEESCLKCHNKVKVSTLPVVHKPVREQACLKCHDVHGSVRKNILTLEYSKDDSSLCISCHDLKETKFRNGTVDLHHMHLKDTKYKKNCQTCHEPHQSSQDRLIKTEFEARGVMMPMKFKATAEGGNCATTCHKSFEYNRSEKIKNESDR